MERKRWIFQILTIVVLFVGFGVQQITYAESDSNIGKFEYEDNSLKPTESTGFPPKEEEKDKNFFIKTLEFGKKKFKEFVDPIVDAGKDAINYVGEKISDGYELTKDKAQDGMQAMNEWWMEQNGWTKSAFILGGGALALAGAVMFTPLAAGAALVMGAGGGLSYGMYALTTDNISFFGGLAWMGLGIASGGASLFLRGAGMAAWGARGSSLLGAGIRGVGGFLGRTALVSGGLSAALAGGTHLYRYFVHGEPINPLAMAKDMVVWGAAGTIAGPLGRFAMAKIGSRLAGLTVGSGVAGTSEYTLGNLFQGKMPNIKTAGKVLTISIAVPVLGLAIAKGAPLLMKGTTTPVAQTTTQISDTAFSQTGSDVGKFALSSAAESCDYSYYQ